MIGDETEYLQPVLGLLPMQRFKPLNSSWAAGLLLFLVMLMETTAVIVVAFWPKTRNNLQCEPLYLILYCHAALWIIVLLIDHILKWHHNKLRLEGYLTAYEQMNKYGSMPFYLVSLGNMVMLMVLTGYQQTYSTLEKACTKDWDSPLVVTLAFYSAEAAVMSYVLITYLVKVHRFNKVGAPPDVNNIDTWEAFTNNEAGFRERGEDLEELLQKQADTLRYYRDAVEVLQRKVMGLTAQLRGDSIN